MATIGIYDYDLMNYSRVIPNLECAKLCSYFRKKKEVTVLTSKLEPEAFSKFYIRKEYDDGVYPDELFAKNVSYGGRAFSEIYVPMEREIELATPDFSSYEKYIDKCGHTKADFARYRRFLQATHLRLSLDEKHIDEKIFSKAFDNLTLHGIVLHDYHLGEIENAFEAIQELSNYRLTLGYKRPIAIANKYPIDIYDSKELLKWSQLPPMQDAFYFRFHGFIENDILVELVTKYRAFSRQIYYMVDEGCSSEKEFLEDRAMKIYKQVLFCRKSNIKILLKYNEGFFKTPELENYVRLLNYYSNAKLLDNFLPTTQTLYKFCSSAQVTQNNLLLKYKKLVSQDDMRDIFKYFRIHNYELFKLFYEWDKVTYKGGEFVNGWTGN